MVQRITLCFAVIAAAFLHSCSPASRISRILRNHPNLKETETIDTFYSVLPGIVDTFKIQKTDTFSRNDTTFIRTSDTIRLERKCPTIQKTKTVIVPERKGKETTKGQGRKIRETKTEKPNFINRLTTKVMYVLLFITGFALGSLFSTRR